MEMEASEISTTIKILNDPGIFQKITQCSAKLPNFKETEHIRYGGGRFKFTYSWGKDEDFPISAK